MRTPTIGDTIKNLMATLAVVVLLVCWIAGKL